MTLGLSFTTYINWIITISEFIDAYIMKVVSKLGLGRLDHIAQTTA